MSKNRSAAGITNIVQYDANKNITFVSGSATLLTVSSSGALTTTGTITAQTLVVQTVTSSVNFVTGSTKFGVISSNTHQFTGSMSVSGSTAYFAGNVGVGTTSPNIGGYGANSRLLTIQGTAGSYGILELTSNSANADGNAIGRLDFGSDGQAANYKAISSIASFLTGSTSTKYGADLRFYTRGDNAASGDPSERMRITAAGNVGIGATNITGKLMVYQGTAGNVFQSIVSNQGGSTRVGINLNPSMNESDVAAYQAQSAIYATDYNYSANIIFATKTEGAYGNALTERMRITSGGSVIIGTTDAFNGEKLRVAGTISSGVSAMTVTGAISTSVPSSTATTVWTCPDFPRVMYYMVFVRIDSGANADTYSAYAVISASNIAGAKLLTNAGSSGMSISVSGRDIKVTQSSGATQNVHTSVIQIFASSGTT